MEFGNRKRAVRKICGRSGKAFFCTPPNKPAIVSGFIFGLVAQLGERRVRNAEVMGSIPTKSTMSEQV